MYLRYQVHSSGGMRMLTAHLFGATGALPAPFVQCGVDATEDALSCRAFAPCEGRRR